MCISRPPASASSVTQPVHADGQGDEAIGPAELEEHLLVVQIRFNAGPCRLVFSDLEVQEIRQRGPLPPGGLEVAGEAEVQVVGHVLEVDRSGSAERPHGEVDSVCGVQRYGAMVNCQPPGAASGAWHRPERGARTPA